MGQSFSLLPWPPQPPIPADAPESKKAFYRLATTNPANWGYQPCRGDPFGRYRTEKTLNGMSLERYQRENEKLKTMNALEYAEMFTKSTAPPPPPDDKASDDITTSNGKSTQSSSTSRRMASNIKASKKSSTSQRKASNSKSSKRPSNSRRKASNDISKSNGKTKASNNSTTSDMRTLDEEDSDDLNGLYGATPPPPRRSTRHTQAETIIKSETGMLEETDSDDPNGLYGASPLLAQQSSRIVPSTFTTGGLNNTVSTVTSSQEMTVGDGNQHHARLKTPEFVPWIPAERYVSPELDGPWKPYQPAQPADQSPHGPVPAPRGVQAGNANVSDESNSSLGESDSDSEFGYISPSQPSKKRKDESDDDYKDPGTKKSSATYQVKQSSSRKTGSKAKNSATSNNSQTSITKSRKRARDYDELEEEEEEPKPKPKKPKTASTSISQYDPKWNIPNGDLGSWHKDTYVALLQILRNIRAQETAAGKTGVQGLRDVKLWNYASAELAKVGHFRSGSACKLFWGRYGRRESQFDERANPDPTRLCTSMQK